MNEFNPIRLPKLRSETATQPLSAHIEFMLKCADIAISPETVIKLTDILEKDLLRGYKQLVAIDQNIGGVGLHNVNKQEGDILTGAYDIQFRGLFRPIQYIYQRLSEDDLVWNARIIILNSCLHVEKALKYRFNISDENRSSLGMLLWQNSIVKKTLDAAFLKLLVTLNKTIYGKNKHTIEHIDMDAHDYSPTDAIAVYLICRWVGLKLLEPTALFSDWEDSSITS